MSAASGVEAKPSIIANACVVVSTDTVARMLRFTTRAAPKVLRHDTRRLCVRLLSLTKAIRHGGKRRYPAGQMSKVTVTWVQRMNVCFVAKVSRVAGNP